MAPRPSNPDAPTRRRFVLIVAVLAVVGVLAAVGSGLDDPGPTAAGPAAGPRDRGTTLTVAWGSVPRSLDPAYASDSTSANLVWNLMDPLVRLDEDMRPVPSLAKGWEVSPNGRRVRFFLREDARWTDGTPVTAGDFEFAWKRVLSRESESPYAAQLLGIAGAAAYHACVQGCAGLARRVGVEARGSWELEVRLASPRPWFPAETAQPAFLAVPEHHVRRLGREWASPEELVTNGPFRLAELDDDSVTLVKSDGFRRGLDVLPARVVGRILPEPTNRVEAFDEGSVMALDGSGLPSTDLPALLERREFAAYPGLGTNFYGFNLRTLLDVHQRRAMALAVDRAAMVENLAVADLAPATRFTPPGLPDEEGDEASPWFPVERDLARARAELDQAAVVKRRLTLLHVDGPRNRDVALALRDAWRALGIETTIRSRPPDEYLDFAGPLSRDSVDLYQVDLRYAYPDPLAGLTFWECRDPRNKTNFCHAGYDELIETARRELDPEAREALTARAEDILFGEEGRNPGLVLFWPAAPNLEALKVAETFRVNPLALIDLWAVDVR